MKRWVAQMLILCFLFAVNFNQSSAQVDPALEYHLVWQTELDQRVELVEWRPQSDIVAVAAENVVILLSAQTGEEIRRIEIAEYSPIADMAWNSNGSLFAAGDIDGWVHIYNEQWEETATFFALWLLALEWHPFRDELLTVNDSETSTHPYEDLRVTVWTLEGEVKHTLKALRSVGDIEFSPDGQYLAGVKWNIQGIVWDAESYSVDHHISLIPSPGTFSDSHFAQSIAWSPDSRRIAFLSNDNVTRIFSFVVWDITDRKWVQKVQGADAFLYSLSWHPLAELLASGWGDGTVRIWDMETYRDALTIDVPTLIGREGIIYSLISSVAWSPDGQFLAVTNVAGFVQVWRIES